MAITGRKARKGRLAASTIAGRAHAKVMARSRPGTGVRFRSMETQLKRKGAKSPSALAAYIGRKKYGKKGMARMAAAGRKRAK